MSTMLEATVDKFTFRVATDRLSHRDGVWALPVDSGRRVRLGLTDFVQQHNGDVTFATVQPAGTVLRVGDALAEIETMKVTLSLPTPISGTIIESNPALAATPEVINQDPFGAGWLAVLDVADWATARTGLLSPEAYFSHMQSLAEAEVGEQ
jgi:glycine cleavage system H protein